MFYSASINYKLKTTNYKLVFYFKLSSLLINIKKGKLSGILGKNIFWGILCQRHQITYCYKGYVPAGVDLPGLF